MKEAATQNRRNMKFSKAHLAPDDYWPMEWHWEIFWDLVELQGEFGNKTCPRCLHYGTFELKDHHMAMRCKKCQKTYSPTANTIFNNSKLYLPIWLKAIYLILIKKPEIKLSELCKEIDCTNVTACNMRKKITTLTAESIEYKLMLKYKSQIIKFML